MPLLILITGVLFRSNNKVIGMLCYVPMSWQTGANAILCFTQIKTYKDMVKKKIFCIQSSNKNTVTTTVGTIVRRNTLHTVDSSGVVL